VCLGVDRDRFSMAVPDVGLNSESGTISAIEKKEVAVVRRPYLVVVLPATRRDVVVVWLWKGAPHLGRAPISYGGRPAGAGDRFISG
jgi:hypothetical protein